MVGERWRAFGTAATAAALAALVPAMRPLLAHDEAVHERITSAAIDYLVARRPELRACAAPRIRQQLVQGSRAEDAPFSDSWPDREYVGRFLFHFLDRLNDTFQVTHLATGVSGRASIISSCSSLNWLAPPGQRCDSTIDVSLAPSCVGASCAYVWSIGNLLDRTTWSDNRGRTRDDLIAGLKRPPGDAKDDAHFTLGHYVHLLQDLTSPAHTHNDAHPEGKPSWDLKLDPSLLEILNKDLGPTRVPTTQLLPVTNDQAFFRSLRDYVAASFHSEKSAAADATLANRQHIGDYAVDTFGRKLAKREWVTGIYTIDDTIAYEQFEELTETAVLYTASLLAYVQDNLAPICEEDLEIGVAGAGIVTSTPDGHRLPTEPDHIQCGSSFGTDEVCSHPFPSGSWVELTATGDDFRGWSDPRCPGTGTCRIRIGEGPQTPIHAVFSDPVAGVYTLTAINGRPVPTYTYDQSNRIFSGEVRFNDSRPWTGEDIGLDGMQSEEFVGERFVPPNTTFNPWRVAQSWHYRIGDVSAVPVPLGPGSPIVLPPGRVIYGVFQNRTIPFATLAADGRTMTMYATSLSAVATLDRQPPIRTVTIDPLDRNLVFDDTLQGEESAPKTVTVTNTGAEALRLRSTPLSNLIGDFRASVVSGPCDPLAFGGEPILPPGDSCTLEFVFRPELTYRQGLRTTSITLGTTAGSTSGFVFRDLTIILEGSATGMPRVEVSPSSLSFPATSSQSIGPPQSVVVRNSGDLPLEISFPRSSSFGFEADATGCRDRSLDPGASCSISVTYRPHLVHAATLDIPTNAGSNSGSRMSTTAVALTAANAPPVAEAVASEAVVRTGATVFLDGFRSSDLEGYQLTYRWLIASAPFGSVATLADTTSPVIEFVPDLPGQYVVHLAVNDGFETSSPDSVVFTAVPPPGVLSLSTGGLIFPETPVGGRSAIQAVSVTNVGQWPVTIASTTFSGDFSASSNSCSTLSVQQTCTLEVLFEPTAAGARSGILTLVSDASNSPTHVVLSGGSASSSPFVPRITAIGEITVGGNWTLRFFGGDDDEESWLQIGNDPGFEWEEDETPGRVVPVNFGLTENTIRISEEDDLDNPRPLTIEPLPGGGYLIHLHDDDPPNETEVTLLLAPVP